MYDPLASITSVATTTTSRKSNKHQLKKHKVHSDLQLGPKRHWTEQQNLVMSRRFHEEMLSNAHSHIAKELNAHEKRLKIAATLFDQSTAQENARRFRQKKTSEENKRLLKRLLKIEMQETEITKTNAPGCAEKVRFRRQRKARRKALRASKQHKLDKINRENGMMLARLQKAKGSLDIKSQKKDYERHKRQGRLMSKMRHVRKFKGGRGSKRSGDGSKMREANGMGSSMSLPSFGSPNEQQRRRQQQQQQQHPQQQQQNQQQLQQHSYHPQQYPSDEDMLASQMHGMMSTSSSSSLPHLSTSPETGTPLRPLNERVSTEQERQRLLGVFSSLSVHDLQARLERYASLLSPHLSVEGFRAMVRDLPKPVLVRTLADVVRQAPQYGNYNDNGQLR